MLLAHRLTQDEEREAWGSTYQDNGLVFCRENRTEYDPAKVTKRFRQLAIDAGVRPVRLHDLRHGAVSLMLAGGMPLALVSKRLGHSSITITADMYTHMIEDANRDATRVTERWCRAPRVTIGDIGESGAVHAGREARFCW